MCLKDDQRVFYFVFFFYWAEFQNVSKELNIDCFQDSPFIDIQSFFPLTTLRLMLRSFYTIKDIQSSLNLLLNFALVSQWKMHSSMSHF